MKAKSEQKKRLQVDIPFNLWVELLKFKEDIHCKWSYAVEFLLDKALHERKERQRMKTKIVNRKEG